MKLHDKGSLFFLLAMFALSLFSVAYAQYETEKMFPNSTQIYFSIANVPEFEAAWNKTETGKLLHDPKFEPFRKTLSTRIEDMWMTRFGMNLTDVLAICSGEIGGGVIAYPGKKAGMALVLDTTDKQEQVNEFLSKLIKQVTNVRNGQARKERVVIGNSYTDAMVLTIPPSEDYKEERVAWYVDIAPLLVVTDQKFLVELILTNMTTTGSPVLVSHPPYMQSLKRCFSDIPADEKALIKFFVNPLEAGEALYSMQPLTNEQKNKPSTYSILAKQGFDGIQGVGGTLNFAEKGKEFVTRVKAYIPNPPQKAFNMLAFSNVAAIPIPQWAGSNLARTVSMNVDPLNIINNFGPLFDEFLETEGAWNDIVLSLEKDENGPKVNLKTDFIGLLGNTLTISRTYTRPIGPGSEKFLASLEVKQENEAKLRAVLHRMFDTDPGFQQVKFDTDVIWQYTPLPKDAQRERTQRSRRPSRPSAQPVVREQTPSEDGPGIIKVGTFCVSDGFLFISNDREFLKESIMQLRQKEIIPLESSKRYQAIHNAIAAETKQTGLFIQGFTHTEKVAEMNYSLFRDGKLRSEATMFSRLVDFFAKKGSSKPLDASLLPPFEEIRDRIGFSGFCGWVEQDGWYFKQFGFDGEIK